MFKKNEDEKELQKKRTVRKLKCFAKKEYIEPEKRNNDIAEPEKIIFRGEHSLPYMFSAAATFHFEMSVLNVYFQANKYLKF